MPATGTLGHSTSSWQGTQADPQIGTFTTYNFEEADWHTYFAAPKAATTTQAAIWVHNLNVGICDQGKEFIRKLRGSNLSPEAGRAAFQS